MCGIIGILGKDDVALSIVEGLKRLEYRGYDSAGVATVDHGRLDRRRASGKLAALAARLDKSPLAGAAGIGHTRWATHGAATDENAHPHATDRLALVHNGIIENFAELRDELKAKGFKFASQTDSEVCAQLITFYLQNENLPPKDAVKKALDRMRGAFAFAIVFSGEDDLLIGARRGSPLAIGRGDGEMYLGSDAYALAPFTNRVTYLEEGDFAVLTRKTFDVFNEKGESVARAETISSAADNMVDKDGHRHFMAKEIHEQPEVIAHTLSRYIDAATGAISLPIGAFDFATLDRVTISACGTAYYAGLISKYWFESWAGLPVEIDIASELRYRDVPYPKNGGALFVSQSGETADTLAALRHAKAHGQKIAAVVNVPESSIAREADIIFPMAAGPEIGVASTKAFTCQLAALAAIALAAGRQRGVLSAEEEKEIVTALLQTPRLVGEAIKAAVEIENVAREIAKATDTLYVGRGVSFPLAMEGALKLKEISYIHAEGYAAGELKHGPIALIDQNMPVIVIAPSDKHFEKTISNMHEIMAREGKAILISDAKGIAQAGPGLFASIEVPEAHPLLSPIVYAAPIQLLAYFTATTKGTDVDQPRNLAKSVTVE
ncbi:MAG: glutamine--fructose-6-phosphate transaminase (isomerizing) [Parvularculaceae bacterium]|nr:glutamine--fructose-6-phosphate transaminase (isomerizing) [Parvularculaceae bacterium]